MPLTGKQMLALFLNDGWEIERINGSHYIMKKNGKTVVIPVHPRDLNKRTEGKILKAGGFR